MRSSTQQSPHHHQQQPQQQQLQQGSERRERAKSVNTVAARMKQVVEKLIQAQQAGDTRQQITVFLYKNQQSEITNAFFQEFQKENDGVFQDRSAFLGLLAGRYDEFCRSIALPPSSSQQQECCRNNNPNKQPRLLLPPSSVTSSA